MTAKDQPFERGRHVGHAPHRALCVDLRWAAVFRFLLGALLLWELACRFDDLGRFYVRSGLTPSYQVLADTTLRPLSLHHLAATPAAVSGVFAVSAGIFLAFAVGWRTRLVHFLAVALSISAAARNPMLLDADSLALNVILVWSLWLPLGRRWSVDGLLSNLAGPFRDGAPAAPAETTFASLAVVGLRVHMVAIFTLTGLHHGRQLWATGNAFPHSLPSTGGAWSTLEPWVSVGVVGAELALVAALLLSPVVFWLRVAAPLLCVGLLLYLAARFGFEATPFALCLPFVLFLDSRELAALLGKVFRRRKRERTVLYDASCGICSMSAELARRLDLAGHLSIVANDDPKAWPSQLDFAWRDKSIVVVDGSGQAWVEERAIAAVLRALPGGLLASWLVLVPGLRALVRKAYRWVAKNRMNISVWCGLGVCGVPSALPGRQLGPRRPGPLGWAPALLAVVFLMLVMARLWTDSPLARARHQPGAPVATLAAALEYPALIQRFGTLGQGPRRQSRLLIDGRTADGRSLDPLTGQAPDLGRTVRRSSTPRFALYEAQIGRQDSIRYRQHLLGWLQRHHESTGRKADRLVAADVWWLRDAGHAVGADTAPVRLLSFGSVEPRLFTPAGKRP